jgi:hypothetical protein
MHDGGRRFRSPIALVAVAVAAALDLNRRRKEVDRMNRHAERAKPHAAEFTGRDRQTPISD